MELELARTTLAHFDEACEALGLDPDRVRSGQVPVEMDREHMPALLAVLAPEADLPDDFKQQVVERAARRWFQAALLKARRAAEVAAEQADEAGVKEVMQSQGSTGKPLSRVVSTLPATDYERIYHEWDMERALTYLMLRSVDHVSENLEDYL